MPSKLSKMRSKVRNLCKSKEKSYHSLSRTEDFLEDEAQRSPPSPMPNLGQVQGDIGGESSSTKKKDFTSSQANGPGHEDGSTISHEDENGGNGFGATLPQIRNPLTSTNAVPGSSSVQRPGSGAEGGSLIAQQGSETAVPQDAQPDVEHNESTNNNDDRPSSTVVQSNFPSGVQSTFQPNMDNTTPSTQRGSRYRTLRKKISDAFRPHGQRSRAPVSTTDENEPLTPTGNLVDNGAKSQGGSVANSEGVGRKARVDVESVGVPFFV